MKLSTARRVIGRKFIDAPQGERCKAVVTLKDGTTADCGRHGIRDGLCEQHARITRGLYNVVYYWLGEKHIHLKQFTSLAAARRCLAAYRAAHWPSCHIERVS